jgi:hypothetical protein
VSEDAATFRQLELRVSVALVAPDAARVGLGVELPTPAKKRRTDGR